MGMRLRGSRRWNKKFALPSLEKSWDHLKLTMLNSPCSPRLALPITICLYTFFCAQYKPALSFIPKKRRKVCLSPAFLFPPSFFHPYVHSSIVHSFH